MLSSPVSMGIHVGIKVSEPVISSFFAPFVFLFSYFMAQKNLIDDEWPAFFTAMFAAPSRSIINCNWVTRGNAFCFCLFRHLVMTFQRKSIFIAVWTNSSLNFPQRKCEEGNMARLVQNWLTCFFSCNPDYRRTKGRPPRLQNHHYEWPHGSLWIWKVQ